MCSFHYSNIIYSCLVLILIFCEWTELLSRQIQVDGQTLQQLQIDSATGQIVQVCFIFQTKLNLNSIACKKNKVKARWMPLYYLRKKEVVIIFSITGLELNIFCWEQAGHRVTYIPVPGPKILVPGFIKGLNLTF